MRLQGGGQFAPETGGQFTPDLGGQVRPERGGQIERIFHLTFQQNISGNLLFFTDYFMSFLSKHIKIWVKRKAR